MVGYKCRAIGIVLTGAGSFAHSADETARLDAAPIGWASVDGGTTGGKEGPTIRVADEASLREKLKGDEPTTILLTAPVVLAEKIRVGSNKTLSGEGKK